MTADNVVFTVGALGMLATAGGVFARARYSSNQLRGRPSTLPRGGAFNAPPRGRARTGDSGPAANRRPRPRHRATTGATACGLAFTSDATQRSRSPMIAAQLIESHYVEFMNDLP